MLLSFSLFALIGFIPFVAAFFGLNIELQFTKKAFPEILMYFVAASVVKLFAVSAILPEIQGHNIQTFVVTMVINSFEFVFFRTVFVQKRVSKSERGKVIAFWWSCLVAFTTSILTFVSNSRMQEMEVHHIVYALANLAYLFLYFAMANFALSISNLGKVSKLGPRQQLLILMFGVPAALASIDPKHVVPAFVPELLKLCAAAALWGVTRLLEPSK